MAAVGADHIRAKVKLATMIVALSCSAAGAANWRPMRNDQVFIDLASVRQDYFSTQQAFGIFTMEPYVVVWIKFTTTEGDVLLETAFNCRGGYEVMQQIVANDTPNLRYHSFDNTQALRNPGRGAQVKSIAPETVYEDAQHVVCVAFPRR